MSIEEHWTELEWRFCRSVANALSMRLIVGGIAVPSLRVFFNGEIKTADVGRKRWREGSVVVEISGRRIDTGLPPYLPADELRSERLSDGEANVPTSRRLTMIRSTRAKREAEIALIAVKAFEGWMRQQALRDSVAATMEALAQRITIPALHSGRGAKPSSRSTLRDGAHPR